MNVILSTILSENKVGEQGATAISNIGYSFNKQSLGQKYGYSSLNNNAVSMINSYFGGLTNNTIMNNSKTFQTGDISNTSTNTQFIISKPYFSHTNHKVTIQLFYYSSPMNVVTSAVSSNNEYDTFKKNISGLSTALAQLFQKEVNLITIRLHYPYLNSDILTKYLAYNASSNTFINFQEAILTNPSLHNTSLPAHISGIKVQVSGRLVTETVVPRVTVKSCLIGSFSVNNPFQFIDFSKFTTKNELGAFTVKVWICQRSATLSLTNYLRFWFYLFIIHSYKQIETLCLYLHLYKIR